MSLWNSLQNLKYAGIDLWNKANKQNLINFSMVLWDTDKLVEKSRIFLEKPHYKELKEILSIFKDFEFGKLKLIKLRDKPLHPSSERELTKHNIAQQIDNNRAIKERYETLLDQIGFSLQDQLSAPET